MHTDAKALLDHGQISMAKYVSNNNDDSVKNMIAMQQIKKDALWKPLIR